MKKKLKDLKPGDVVVTSDGSQYTVDSVRTSVRVTFDVGYVGQCGWEPIQTVGNPNDKIQVRA